MRLKLEVATTSKKMKNEISKLLAKALIVRLSLEVEVSNTKF